MPLPLPTSRFPLLGKAAAIGLVLLALTLALEAVSGIVHEREGRLREAEASVAASLAGSQTVLGPLLQRDCSETWEAVQGEGKDRKVVTERRTWKLAAAPADLDVSAQVALEPRYRGIFKVNGYVMKATLAATWPDGGALVPRAEHAGSRVRCDAPQVLLALGDTRGVRGASVQVDGGDAAVCRAPGIASHPRGLHAAVDEAWAGAARPLAVRMAIELVGTGDLALAPVGESTRVALALGLAASVVRGRFLPLERTVDDTGFRAVWS
jgi:inner membrane protein